MSERSEFGSFPTQPARRRAAEAQAEAVPLSVLPFLVTFLRLQKVTRHARASPGADYQSKANIPSARTNEQTNAQSKQSARASGVGQEG
ncbi:MAG: hypothetical protein JWP52_2237 [Rhizobacter sp.]|nr:hypothetical protein [Rhizobacter sp.]